MSWPRASSSGTLVVPRFVVAELQHIADNRDQARRVRGRRGLEVLDVLQKDQRVAVELSDEDPASIEAVDAKLIELARRRGAGDPDQRLQPQPRSPARRRPRPQPQPARQRAQAGVPARRRDPGQGHPAGQGARPGPRLSRRRDDDRGRGRWRPWSTARSRSPWCAFCRRSPGGWSSLSRVPGPAAPRSPTR